MLKRIDQKENMFYNCIGTVGGGNHFVEVGVTPEGNYAFTVHCGSRNLGQKVWKYWKMKACNQTGVTNGFLVEDAMKGYITDMVVAQAYAEFNLRLSTVWSWKPSVKAVDGRPTSWSRSTPTTTISTSQ